jgi:4-amino-4-deoxy-L-arabinose transferase-like glycosyltransferase
MRKPAFFKSTTFWLGAILLLALTVRLAYLILVVGPNSFPTNIDSVQHHLIAQSVVEGNGYSMYGHPTAYRAPFLTYFMVISYEIFGQKFTPVRLGMILLSLVLIWAIFYLAKQIFTEKVGLWAALMAAVYPHLIFYNARIFTETPFALFILLATIFFIRFVRKPKTSSLVLTALFSALAILTRPVGFVLLGFFVIYLLFRQPVRHRISRISVLIVLVILFISPWIIRNYRVFHRFVPVTTQGALVLWVGNNHYVAHHPYLKGMSCLYQHLPGARKLITPNEIDRAHYSARFFVEFLREYPQDIPLLLWNKTVRFWEMSFLTGSSRRWMYEYSYLVILILAIAGIILTFKTKHPDTIFLWMILLTNFIPALIFWAGARIRLPAEPVLIILGATIIERFSSRIWQKISS